MFCYQCEQTKDGAGCTTFGVCGKDPISAALQDLLVHATEGVSMYAHRARQSGARDVEVDRFVVEALFTTVTNVNFDPDRLEALVRRAATMRDRARDLAHQGAVHENAPAPALSGPAAFTPAATRDGLVQQTRGVDLAARRATGSADVVGLQELLTYGLKGAAASGPSSTKRSTSSPAIRRT